MREPAGAAHAGYTGPVSPVRTFPVRRFTGGRLLLAALLLAIGVPAAHGLSGQAAAAPAGADSERIVGGVDLVRLSDPALLDPEGPIEVLALRIDPERAHLEITLAEDRTPALETVPDMAVRQGAVAAVNGGFFGPRGSPQGVLRRKGQWIGVSAARARGAVAIVAEGGRSRLLFDRIRVSLTVETKHRGRHDTIAIDHVNPPGAPPGLSLYTPAYVDPRLDPAGGPAERTEAPADPAQRKLTLICYGMRCRVLRRNSGAAAITVAHNGLVLVYRGRQLPPAVARLDRGAHVILRQDVETLHGTPARAWATAADIIGGAGLLLVGGTAIEDWEPERMREDFVTLRHPRTMVGSDTEGFIWLVVVDGRRPDSLGMRLDEIQRLARRLGLVDALNLDGGGSTTLVIDGKVVNRPSDLTGPRPVSDGVLVFVP
jgi:hypothetical protein